jgi:hypothetical protein
VEEHREAQCLSKQEVGEESEDRRGLAEVWVYVPAELVSRIGRSLIRTSLDRSADSSMRCAVNVRCD